MSLTSEQKKDLKQLGKQLRDLEKTAMENSIDLDVFITEYVDDDINLFATEKISQNSGAGTRKRVFEKHAPPPKKVSIKN